MRTCQICNSDKRQEIVTNYHDFEGLHLYECGKCGHRYVDGVMLSQAWFDNYYLTKYQTDDKPYSDARLNSLAECVASYTLETVVDIGGKDLELVRRLINRNVTAYPADVNPFGFSKVFDGVILSHTLEHIYDIGVMFDRIDTALIDAGYLFIEVPIHLGYQEPKAYDLHWQHINKFRPQDLKSLLTKKGFEVMESYQIAAYREYNVWRIVGRKTARHETS